MKKKWRWNKRKFARNMLSAALRFLAVIAFLAFASIGPLSWYGL